MTCQAISNEYAEIILKVLNFKATWYQWRGFEDQMFTL